MYEISFNRVQLDVASYQAAIEYFRQDTERVSELAENRGHYFLLSALAAYTSQYTVGGGTVQFYAVGDASYIYDTYVDKHVFMSRSDVCLPSDGTLVYDRSISSFVYSLTTNRTEQIKYYLDDYGNTTGYSEYTAAEEVCPGMFNIGTFYGRGVFSGSSIAPATITVNFDIRSIATIIGIHSNITSLENLQVVNTKYTNVSVDENTEYTYAIREYVDPYYEGMAPILCESFRKKSICVLKVQDLYYLPVIINAGNFSTNSGVCYNNEYLVQCKGFACQGQVRLSHFIGLITVGLNDLMSIADNFAQYDEFQSQVFDLLSFGAILGFSETYEKSLTFAYCNKTVGQYLNQTFTNLFSFSGTDAHGDQVVYNQTMARDVDADDDSDDSSVYNEFALMLMVTDNKFNNHVRDLRDTGNGTLVGQVIDGSGIIYPYSIYPPNWPISTYHNKLYVKNVFDVIANSPPASLLSETMTCTTSPSSAAIAAIGVSISNATQAANFGFILMVTLFMMVINKRHKEENKPLLMKVSEKHNLNVIAEIGILEEMIRHAQGVDKERCLALLEGIKKTTMIVGKDALDAESDETDYVYERQARDAMIKMNLFPEAARGSFTNRKKSILLSKGAVSPEPQQP